MKFSILIAVYNASAWLPTLFRSLRAQREGSFEAIFVDDCSTDDSAALIRSAMEGEPRFRLLATPQNSGQAVARNVALREACGELTLMLDADDWLAPDALEQVWATFTARPDTDAVLFRLKLWYSPERVEDFALSPRASAVMSGREACLLSLGWGIHGLYAVRTEIFKRIPYDTSCRLYSDDNTTHYHFLAARSVAQSEGVYFYRQHPRSATHRVSADSFLFLTANDSLRRQMEAYGVDAAMLRECEDYVWRIYVGVFRTFRQHRREFSPELRADVARRLRHSYSLMRFRRLPLRTALRPCYFPLPYPLFRLWQALLMLRHRG